MENFNSLLHLFMDNLALLKALFLGLIEGLTEFLPISSTGHLILFGHLIDFKSDSGRVFEVVIQFGAILAVCWLYRQKIIALIRGFFQVRCMQDALQSMYLWPFFLPWLLGS